jgi:hypothetical protein
MAYYKFILDNTRTDQLELAVNPANWDDIGINMMRSDDYYSILRTFTLPLKFGNYPDSGYDYILNEYNLSGIYANVYIFIFYRNSETNDWVIFYSGKIDFKPPKFNHEMDLYIEAAIIDNDKLEKLKARHETEFNLLDTTTPDGVTIPAITNKKTINLPDIPIILECSAFEARSTINQIISYGNSVTGLLDSWDIQKNMVGDTFAIDSDKVYVNPHAETVNVSFFAAFNYEIKATQTTDPSNNGTVDHRVRAYIKLYDSGGTQLNQQQIYLRTTRITVNSSGNLIFTYTGATSGQISADVPSGGYAVFYSETSIIQVSTTHANVSCFTDFKDGVISITELNPGIGDTTAECYFPDEVFTHLVQLVTSETDTSKLFRADVFGRTDSSYETYSSDGDYSKDAILNGLMIRKFPTPAINVSLKKIFKFFDSCYNLGMGYDYVNQKFYVAGKSAFFDSNTLIKDLGEVKNLKISPMQKAYFSEISAGYDYDGEYEDYNGALEFNLKKYYSTPAPVVEKLDLIAPYRADSIGIQLTRNKQYMSDATVDTKGDNDIFVIKTDGTDPTKAIFIGGFNGADYYYNSEITPRQNMVRWGNMIGTSLYRNTNPIKYVKSEKECPLLIYSDPETYIDENTDIAKNELGDLLILPETYTFESALDEGDLQSILSNPHGYFKFTFRGKNYEGFIDKLDAKDYKLSSKFELIAKNTEVIYRTFEDGDMHLFTDDSQKING